MPTRYRTTIPPATLSQRCSYCGTAPLILGDNTRVAPRTASLAERLETTYYCGACSSTHLVVWYAKAEGDQERSYQADPGIYPPSPGARICEGHYDNTLFSRLYHEAWRCYHARRIRAAALVGRTALQCLVRLYVNRSVIEQVLPTARIPRDHDPALAVELKALAELVDDDDWLGVGHALRKYANDLTHPDGKDLASLDRSDARAALDDLGAIAARTATLERSGRLVRVI